MDIKLNENGRLDLSSGGLELVEGKDAIIQRVKIRLQTFLGEWFYDLSVGIPYFQLIFVKNPDLTEIENVFRASIVDVPGIARVASMTLNYRADLRTLNLSFVAVFDSSIETESQCEEVFLSLDLDAYVSP